MAGVACVHAVITICLIIGATLHLFLSSPTMCKDAGCAMTYYYYYTPITSHRYNSWVASKDDPPHLTAFLPTSIKHMIIRFRVTTCSYPLAFQSTKHKRKKIPRSHRFCVECQQHSPCTQEGELEDDLHFWIECPAYSEIRKLYPSLFSIDATPKSILHNPDQDYFLERRYLKCLRLEANFAD